MNIVCASDSNFVAHTATTLASVAAHHHAAKVHWIFSDLTNPTRSRLAAYFDTKGLDVSFYPALFPKNYNLPTTGHASLANYYRLLCVDVLPTYLTRVLYLDSDVMVRKCLLSLWNHEMEGKPVAAVQDSISTELAERLGLGEAGYFNSGVMLLDLDQWREENLGRRVFDFIHENHDKIRFWDQDGLNAVLHGNWSRLRVSYNAQQNFYDDVDLSAAYRSDLADPHIVHFCGVKPWQHGFDHPFKSEYRHYRLRTPWEHYLKSCVYQQSVWFRAQFLNIDTYKRAVKGLPIENAARRLFRWITAPPHCQELAPIAVGETRTAKMQEVLTNVFQSSYVVRTGPFTGMRYPPYAFGSQMLPKMAGTYEQPLHWVIERFHENPMLQQVVNIGCAEGYYAVGLKLLRPDVDVYAFDSSEEALARCRELAAENGVEVHNSRVCTYQTLNELVGSMTLVICDIEGAEEDLIDPILAPALRMCELVVETHDFLRVGVTEALIKRFRKTHRIAVLIDGPRDYSALIAKLQQADVNINLDELKLILDEVRPMGMRWLHMVPIRTPLPRGPNVVSL